MSGLGGRLREVRRVLAAVRLLRKVLPLHCSNKFAKDGYTIVVNYMYHMQLAAYPFNKLGVKVIFAVEKHSSSTGFAVNP